MRTIFLLRGAPASGKSTWVKENELDSYTISTDTLRLMYQSPITNTDGTCAISQNNDKLVWDMVMQLMEKRMSNGEFLIIDATHYKSILLNRYIDLIKEYRYKAYVVDFSKISEEELLERNAKRGFRRVPDDVISKMVVALADDSEVKNMFNIISPQEALKMIQEPLKPYRVPENYKKVVVIGDIHGCYTPLKEYFDKNPFNEETNYIFCGDYLDRGIENKEVLEFLISLKDKKNCVFLEGNHEKWLKIYSQKDYDMTYYQTPQYEYQDIFITKILSQLKDKANKLQNENVKNKKIMEDLSNLLKQVVVKDPDIREVFYNFELVNVPQRQKELSDKIKQNEHNLEVLKMYIYTLEHEQHNSEYSIDLCRIWYEYTFNSKLSINISNLLEKKFNVTANKKENPIKSVHFIYNTYPQIKDINKKDIREFCNRLAQMSYFTFNSHDYLVTHAGIPCLPTIKTQSIEFIKGIGKYEEHELIDKTFYDLSMKNKDYTVQIHGHRNAMRVPICTNGGNTFNLEGQVEFGGNLRILELTEQGYNCIEIPNTVYESNMEDNMSTDSVTDLQILKEMIGSKWINVKTLTDSHLSGLLSFNFTHEAFEKGHWNNHTCTARGLFVDGSNGNIVARSYNKFFNHRETEDTKTAGLKQNFAFPVIGYKKENGFLGIISKYQDQVRIFTKGSNDGDFVNWFIGVLCNHYKITSGYCLDPYLLTLTYSEMYNKMLQLKGDNEQLNRQLRNTELCIEEVDNINNEINKNNYMIDKIVQTLDLYKVELCKTLNNFIEEGYSYVFECIDPNNDPHIIKYDKEKVILLEVFKNQLKEETLCYEDLCETAQKLNVEVKQKELVFDDWQQFEEWKDKFTKGITQWDCRHEGYVFEDANHFRVKFKSSFYKFWKQMRSVKDSIASGKANRKVYKTKEEIQVVKILESIERSQLKQMSIIDIEDRFYDCYN